MSSENYGTSRLVDRALDLAKEGITAGQLLSKMPEASSELIQDLLHQGVLAKDPDGSLRPRYTQIKWRSDGTAVGTFRSISD